jgi:malate dehydrogenase
MKITLLGAAGGIGQALALLLKMQLPAHSILSLYDISPVTPGVAVDLSHIPTTVSVTGYSGPDPTEALEEADLVLVAAGFPRKPGMERSDLFKTNAIIIQSLLQTIAKITPHACIGIITNPVDSLVPLAAEILKQAQVYNWRKLFGITTLDLTRATTFIAELKGCDPYAITIPVIGGHSGQTILPLFSQVPHLTFNDSEIATLTQRIQQAGTEVGQAKAGHGSATLAMAYAGAQFALSLIRALQGEPQIEVTAYVDCEALNSRFFSRPLLLGPDGIAQRQPIGPLSPGEQQALEQLLITLRADILLGEQYAVSPVVDTQGSDSV